MHCKAFMSHPALGFPTSRPWPRYLQTCHFTVTAIHSRDWSRQNLNHWSLCEGCTMLYTCLRMLTFWKRVLQNTEGLISEFYSLEPVRTRQKLMKCKIYATSKINKVFLRGGTCSHCRNYPKSWMNTIVVASANLVYFSKFELVACKTIKHVEVWAAV